MNFLKTLALSVVALLVLVVAGSQFLPAGWKVTRSTVIQAPGTVILPFIADFKTGWPQWSTFDTEDPGIVYTYSGPQGSVGAERSWVSKKMGNGTQKILKADAKTGVEFDLVMPDYKMQMRGRFDFEAVEGGTKVSWTDEGEMGRNPMQRIMGRFMDPMMGPIFEASLAKLKAAAEAKAAQAPKAKKN